MSWLNFNNSLSTIKGQISNFASNVLVDEDEGSGITEKDCEELKNICTQQEIEINNLKRINEELTNRQVLPNLEFMQYLSAYCELTNPKSNRD